MQQETKQPGWRRAAGLRKWRFERLAACLLGKQRPDPIQIALELAIDRGVVLLLRRLTLILLFAFLFALVVVLLFLFPAAWSVIPRPAMTGSRLASLASARPIAAVAEAVMLKASEPAVTESVARTMEVAPRPIVGAEAISSETVCVDAMAVKASVAETAASRTVRTEVMEMMVVVRHRRATMPAAVWTTAEAS